jgi:hypothetical protein
MRTAAFVLALALSTTVASAEQPDFSGRWTLDLLTPAERSDPLSCGIAEFDLIQRGNRISGSHSMVTVGCSRQNEGGDETVKGVVVDQMAVLVVTSGRNGAVVLGTAKIRDGALYWETLEQIRDGEPEGDSPLILDKGTLRRAAP